MPLQPANGALIPSYEPHAALHVVVMQVFSSVQVPFAWQEIEAVQQFVSTHVSHDVVAGVVPQTCDVLGVGVVTPPLVTSPQ